MSIELINKAFKVDLQPTPKLLLIALCDYASDDGICFPSLKTIQSKVNIGKTNLTYLLKTFEYLGVLERNKRKRDNGSYTSTTYTIKNIDSITQEKFQIVYQQIKGYLKKSQSELVSKKIPVNNDGLKSEHLEPSSLKHHKNLSSRKRDDFNTFRKKVITKWIDQPLVKGVPDFLSDTVIALSPTGYLRNCVTQKDLEPHDAIAVWGWLYQNPHMIGNVNNVTHT